MPATSKAQQKAAGAALAAKRGAQPKSTLQGASTQMEESMTETQLEEFASTKRKGLPAKTGSAPSRNHELSPYAGRPLFRCARTALADDDPVTTPRYPPPPVH